MKTCRQETLAGFTVKIEQHEDTRALFRVTYGAQVRDNLTYTEAAKEYGLCVFHALACDGELNNERE
jgi:hypothetical protein